MSSSVDNYNISDLTTTANNDTDGSSQNLVALVPLVMIFATEMLVAVVGNVLVIMSYFRDSSLHNVYNLYILNLATADMFIGLCSVNFYIIYCVNYWSWSLGRAMCKLNLCIDFTLCTVTVFLLVVISWNRLILVNTGLLYPQHETKKVALVKLLVVWIFPILLFYPALIGWDYWVGKSILKDNKCDPEFSKNIEFTVVTSVVQFYFPFIAIAALNWTIYRKITTRSWMPHKDTFSPIHTSSVVLVDQASTNAEVNDHDNPDGNSSSKCEGKHSFKPDSDEQDRDTHDRDTQDRDTQNRDTQDRDTQDRDTQDRDTQHRDTQHRGRQNRDSQVKDSQDRDTQNRDTQDRDTQNRDTQNRDTQDRDTQDRDTQNRDTQDRDTQNRDTQNRDTQVKDSQDRDTQDRDTQDRDTQDRDTQVKDSQVKDSQDRYMHDRTVAKALALLVVVFAVCWVPYSVITIIRSLCYNCFKHKNFLLPYIFCLNWSKSCINPFLYAYSSRGFRKNMKEILSLCFKRNIKGRAMW